jgi:membrane-associated phospholipid phosphatase
MAGRAGNSGSAGNSGGVGAVGGGSMIPVLPDRVDLPFVTVDDPPGIFISDKRIDIQRYPDRRWSAEWRAWYALSEYVATGWNKINIAPWVKTPADVQREIEDLVITARDERADALGEIVAQHEDFASYFFSLLTLDPAGYPATNLLINIASIVGVFTALRFKNGVAKSNGYAGYEPRPRPSQVCPALSPPVPVPGHPSYPSGHSTEAHLIEGVLNEMFTGTAQAATMAIDLAALADRIARNREIAGVHYPSDSAAGKQLANAILPYMHQMDIYKSTLPIARAEWQP